MLCIALPSLAWGDFFTDSEYLKFEILPEIRLIHDAYLNVGKPNQARIRALNKLLRLNKKSGNILIKVQATLYLVSLHAEQGRNDKAEQLLLGIEKLIRKLGNKKIPLYYSYQAGVISFSNKHYQTALAFYTTALRLAQEIENTFMAALTRQAIGEVQLVTGNRVAALKNFKSAYENLRDQNLVIYAADAGILYLALKVKMHQNRQLGSNLRELLASVRLTPNEDKRLQQITELSDIISNLPANTLPDDVKANFYELARESIATISRQENAQTHLAATIDLARFYEGEGKYQAALDVVTKSLSHQNASMASSDLITLYIQKARLLMLTDNISDAIASYQDILQVLKDALLHGSPYLIEDASGKLFRVYDALIELNFRRNTSVADEQLRFYTLSVIRDYIEERNYFYFKHLLKEDYGDFTQRKESINALSGKAAIVYPVVYDDRVELLVNLPKGLRNFTSRIEKYQLIGAVGALRSAIEQSEKNNDYKNAAMDLYRWLIGPMKMQLLQQNVTSLVFVLDKTLAMLPVSVLFDKIGRRFLVEQYAVSESPGLMLTDITKRRGKLDGTLFMGVTTVSEKLVSPQFVLQEKDRIGAINRLILELDDAFTEDNIKNAVVSVDYRTVHISAPVVIARQFENSYAAKNRTTIPLYNLSSIIKQKKRNRFGPELDLVVFSGGVTRFQNSTSDGGFLALAHMLGSKTAILSLWQQESEATPIFMEELYTNLSTPWISSASAIRRAKMRLIASRKFQHPAYWARYELIGSWR